MELVPTPDNQKRWSSHSGQLQVGIEEAEGRRHKEALASAGQTETCGDLAGHREGSLEQEADWTVRLRKSEEPVDARDAIEYFSDFNRFNRTSPDCIVLLRALINNQSIPNLPEALAGLESINYFDDTGRLRPIVKAVFLASYEEDEKGNISFVKPYEPVTAKERIVDLKIQARQDQGMARLFTDLLSDDDKLPSRE
jgi:hypothetical protein